MAEAAAGTVRALRVRRPRRAVLCGIAGACDGVLHAGDVVEIVEDSVAALPAAYRLSYLTPDRTKPITADYTGFTVDDLFVVGYGLDYAEKYRNLPYIGILKPAVYEKA